MQDGTVQLLRSLPGVGEFLDSPAGRVLAAEFGEGMTKWALRQVLEEMRGEIRAGRIGEAVTAERLRGESVNRLSHAATAAGRRAINATGILLHTGLGRAALCEAAIEAMRVAAGYTPLQASLESGDRSLREARAEQLLRELTGCEAATVVNNNAAATMLILNTLAGGGAGRK